MNAGRPLAGPAAALRRAAGYGAAFRRRARPLHPTATLAQLRSAFCLPLPEAPADGAAVIDALIAAAEPGLVGTTDPNFFAWVIGGSDQVGVAADWLTSIWGQNAGIYQSAPAAAVAEEAVAGWLLELLDLPREASVGLVTGSTMAGFACLAAARGAVLARSGHDFAAGGLQGAPKLHVFLSDDAHASNFAALRFLGFGGANLVRIAPDARGLMPAGALAEAMAARQGPKIVLAQAGHINSGGFEDFVAISALAREHGAWMHVDGAFGLWTRVLPEKTHLATGAELADSWSVDGHKWLQIPYDSGFAIVRDAGAHRAAMDITGGYLSHAPGDGRCPTEFSPELSRRARGFAAWAVLRSLGRQGVREMVRRHCEAASLVAARLAGVPGLEVCGPVDLNQVVLAAARPEAAARINRLAAALNAEGRVFVRPADWRGRRVLRLSLINCKTGPAEAEALAGSIRNAWSQGG